MSSGIGKVNISELKKRNKKLYILSRKQAKKLLTITKKTYRVLLKKTNATDSEKQDSILKLRKQIHESDIYFYKMFGWFQNITRKIQEGIRSFRRGVKNINITRKIHEGINGFKNRVKKINITRKIHEGIDGLKSSVKNLNFAKKIYSGVKNIFTRKSNTVLNNNNSSPFLTENTTLINSVKYQPGPQSQLEFNIRDLLRRMKYKEYFEANLTNEIVKKEFFEKTVEAFSKGIEKKVISFPYSTKKAISMWNNLISDECGRTFVNKIYLGNLENKYAEFEKYKMSKELINMSKNGVYTGIAMLLANGPKEGGFADNFLFTDDGYLIGLKDKTIEREGYLFNKECLEKLLSKTNISTNKKTEWMQHFFPPEEPNQWNKFE